MRKKELAPTEAQEQKALFEWADWAKGRWPALALLFHIPNGGSRDLVEARHLKAQGVRPGVPDICLPVPNSMYAALYIELKRRRGARSNLSDAQKRWIYNLNKAGNKAVVAHGFEEARDAIMEYLTR